MRWRLGQLLALPAIVLGCPCCGPEWYKSYMRFCFKVGGEPLPPELERSNG